MVVKPAVYYGTHSPFSSPPHLCPFDPGLLFTISSTDSLPVRHGDPVLRLSGHLTLPWHIYAYSFFCSYLLHLNVLNWLHQDGRSVGQKSLFLHAFHFSDWHLPPFSVKWSSNFCLLSSENQRCHHFKNWGSQLGSTPFYCNILAQTLKTNT